MSHDQKPGRMRMVGGGSTGLPAATPQRRRHDPNVIENEATLTAPVGTRGASVKLLAVLFLFGCMAGGIALPLLGVR